jgi:peptide/nickel transport system ATP-binding protein/oligopeptide transport system ATP-binding protein
MHPYTTALLSAVPIPDTQRRTKRERIRLEGDVPSPVNPPPACRFHTRCWKAQEICRTETPPLVELAPRHQVACHFPENVDLPDPALRPGASSPLQAAAAELLPDGEVPHDDASRAAPRVIPRDASDASDASGDGSKPDDA